MKNNKEERKEKKGGKKREKGNLEFSQGVCSQKKIHKGEKGEI